MGRRLVTALTGLLVGAAVWGIGVLLFPQFGDRAYYATLAGLAAVGATVLVLTWRRP
jgi:hypothetical protein